jgi:hypothetical protein
MRQLSWLLWTVAFLAGIPGAIMSAAQGCTPLTATLMVVCALAGVLGIRTDIAARAGAR